MALPSGIPALPRIKISKILGSSSFYDEPLESFLRWIESVKTRYPDAINITIETGDEYGTPYVYINGKVDETDEQYEVRCIRDFRMKELAERREREDYEKLRKKFES